MITWTSSTNDGSVTMMGCQVQEKINEIFV